MSTDIAKYSDTMAAFEAVANDAGSLKGGEGGKAFMKFNGQRGGFSYGSSNDDLAVGTQLVMNPLTYRKGWVLWVGSKPVDEKMAYITDKTVTEADLRQDLKPYSGDDGPVEQYTIEFAMTEEPYTEMVFQANNTSKRRAFAALMKDFGATYKNHPNKFPVIEIDQTEFETKTKEGRKTTMYAPVFKIITWITAEQMEEMKEGSPADYEGAAVEAEIDTTPTPAPKRTVAPAKVAAPARKAGRF